MYAKIQITGEIELKTGMHIGGSSAYAAIGAVDSPIVKDTRSNLPMLPGSSLKGKMRALLAREYNDAVCEPDNDAECLTRLFGCAKNGQYSRVLISDMILSNEDELRQHGLQSLTEIKFENTINRMTAVATPRQIERAVRGSKFPLDIMYEAENEDEIVEDMKILSEGFKLLQYDYIGGSGSRGYGKIIFNNLNADVVIGEVDAAVIEQCNKALKEVEA